MTVTTVIVHSTSPPAVARSVRNQRTELSILPKKTKQTSADNFLKIAAAFMILFSAYMIIEFVTSSVLTLSLSSSLVYSGMTMAQALQSGLLVVVLLASIEAVFFILFGYVGFKLGDRYDIGSFKFMAIIWIGLSVGTLILLPFFAPISIVNSSLLAAGTSFSFQYRVYFLPILYALLAAFAWFMCVMGVSAMKKTRTAKVLWYAVIILTLVGIIFSLVVPVALMIFAAALLKLAQAEEERTSGRVGRQTSGILTGRFPNPVDTEQASDRKHKQQDEHAEE